MTLGEYLNQNGQHITGLYWADDTEFKHNLLDGAINLNDPKYSSGEVLNADKFREVFGIFATELWSMPREDFLKWLNSEYGKRRTECEF